METSGFGSWFHPFFFLNFSSMNESKGKQSKPFALAYVNLMQDNGTTLSNQDHELYLYNVSVFNIQTSNEEGSWNLIRDLTLFRIYVRLSDFFLFCLFSQHFFIAFFFLSILVFSFYVFIFWETGKEINISYVNELCH